MSVAITKVEMVPQSVDCGSEFKISVWAYEVTNGAGDRELPFRLRSDDEKGQLVV